MKQPHISSASGRGMVIAAVAKGIIESGAYIGVPGKGGY